MQSPFRLVRRDMVEAMYACAPTDAEIDDLCRAMWGDQQRYRGIDRLGVRLRSADRTRMRAFLAAINGDQ
jgi:hypothetical protein